MTTKRELRREYREKTLAVRNILSDPKKRENADLLQKAFQDEREIHAKLLALDNVDRNEKQHLMEIKKREAQVPDRRFPK